MVDTPKSAFPVISEGTVLRIKLGTLIAIFATVIVGVSGGVAWATSVNDRLSRIETALGIDEHPTHRTPFGPELTP